MQHAWSNLFELGKLYRVVVNSCNGTKLSIAPLTTFPKYHYFQDVRIPSKAGWPVLEQGKIFMCVGIVRFRDFEFQPEPPQFLVVLYGERMWVFNTTLENLWYRYKFEEVS